MSASFFKGPWFTSQQRKYRRGLKQTHIFSVFQCFFLVPCSLNRRNLNWITTFKLKTTFYLKKYLSTQKEQLDAPKRNTSTCVYCLVNKGQTSVKSNSIFFLKRNMSPYINKSKIVQRYKSTLLDCPLNLRSTREKVGFQIF